ncbi:hypothetical protein PMIN01_07394 [Paraphaeosphaeria minitans]|uniref:Uncharacterized protein n=1 Tax=Paraphaeosphaeria minitans TaxID=565426 RepID=A0A9P6GG14_9PLEO|nr:hypothetical protein PMIN01_07394 [Paraphaeosphaeria minitans]
MVFLHGEGGGRTGTTQPLQDQGIRGGVTWTSASVLGKTITITTYQRILMNSCSPQPTTHFSPRATTHKRNAIHSSHASTTRIIAYFAPAQQTLVRSCTPFEPKPFNTIRASSTASSPILMEQPPQPRLPPSIYNRLRQDRHSPPVAPAILPPPPTFLCAVELCPTRFFRGYARCSGGMLCHKHERVLEEACRVMFEDWYRDGETARGVTPVGFFMWRGRMVRMRWKDDGWVWVD